MLLLPSLRNVRLVNPDRADTSEMLVPSRPRAVSLVKLDKGVISEIGLSYRYNCVRFRPDSADTSEMLLLPSLRNVRLVNPDSADTSEMLFPKRLRYVRLVKLDKGVISEMQGCPKKIQFCQIG